MVLTLLTAPKANCRSAQKVSESKLPRFSIFRCFCVASVRFLGSTSGRSTRSGRPYMGHAVLFCSTEYWTGVYNKDEQRITKGVERLLCKNSAEQNSKKTSPFAIFVGSYVPNIARAPTAFQVGTASCMQNGIERVLNGCWTGIDGIGRGIERDLVSQGLLFSATADDPARKNSLQWKLLYMRQQWTSGSKYLCQGVAGL